MLIGLDNLRLKQLIDRLENRIFLLEKKLEELELGILQAISKNKVYGKR